jgi:hypothetical protein
VVTVAKDLPVPDSVFGCRAEMLASALENNCDPRKKFVAVQPYGVLPRRPNSFAILPDLRAR